MAEIKIKGELRLWAFLKIIKLARTPIWICLFVIVLLAGFVYIFPELMVEGAQLFSLFFMPFLAFVISAIVSSFCIIKFKVKWYVTILSIPLSIFAAFASVVAVLDTPELENHIYALFQSRQFDFIATNDSYNEAITLQSSLPVNLRGIVAVDGSDAPSGIYWFVSSTDPNLVVSGSPTEYLVGFYNAKDQHTSDLHIDDLWHIVQTQKHLPVTLHYNHFSGIPIIQEKSFYALNIFSKKRTISFYTSGGRKYEIKLIRNRDSLLTSVS